jgi:hypothetical protein
MPLYVLFVQEITAYERRYLLLDYRFSARLADECDEDIFQHCGQACDVHSRLPCNGTVIECLKNQEASALRKECSLEVQRLVKLKVC